MTSKVIFIFPTLLLCCFMSFTSVSADAQSASTPASLPGITAADGENLTISALLTPEHLVVSLAHPVHDWFAGTFTHLTTASPTAIELSMDGNDTERNIADVSKWLGLHPLFTYADPKNYTSYEWFEKDSLGRWVSGDPLKAALETRFAGTGSVPEQQAIPTALAPQFLSADGRYWQAWCDIDKATALPKLNSFVMQQHFVQSMATLAMRIPFSYTMLQAFLDKLHAAKLPGVSIDEIGASLEKRKLQVIRLEPPTMKSGEKDARPTILVYAREHATEPDGSWAIYGMLHWLLSDTPEAQQARAQVNWLLIPILDPDDAVHSLFNVGDNYVTSDQPSPEAFAYATYLVKWIDAGHRLDMAVNLHNIECTEGPHLFVPWINVNRQAEVTACNRAVLDAVHAAGYTVGDPQGRVASMQSFRLSVWTYRMFHTLDLIYELNSRQPADPLTLARTQAIGVLLARQLAGEVQSPAFTPLKNEIIRHLGQRQEQRAAWWEEQHRNPMTRTPYDLFSLGY